MIKKIKEWLATNRKLKEEKKEREFKCSLNKEYLITEDERGIAYNVKEIDYGF